MPLVKAQCTNCGGTLEVDNLKDAAICPFCNTPYIVEKAINVYNTYYNNGVSKESIETLVKKGVTQINVGEFVTANKIFKKAIEEYPTDYRAWIGLCVTEFLTSKSIPEHHKHNAIHFSPALIQSKLGDFSIYNGETQKKLEKQQEHYKNTIKNNIGDKATGIEKIKDDTYDTFEKLGVVFVFIFHGFFILVGIICMNAGYSPGIIAGILGIFFLIRYLTNQNSGFNIYMRRKKSGIEDSNRLKEIVEYNEKELQKVENDMAINKSCKPISYYVNILRDI